MTNYARRGDQFAIFRQPFASFGTHFVHDRSSDSCMTCTFRVSLCKLTAVRRDRGVPCGRRDFRTAALCALTIDINICRFIDDMQRASALFRLLGDATRLRLLRVLAHDRFNVTELTGILGARAVRRLPPSRPAEGRRPRRRGARSRLRLLPPCPTTRGTTATAPLWALLDAQFAAAASDQAVRAGRGAAAGSAAAPQGELRDARRRAAARARAGAGRPGRARSATCCRRSTSPTSAAARLPHARSGALGAHGRRHRSLRRGARARQGAGGAAAASPTCSGRRATSRGCRCATRRSTSRCCRRRCITPATPSARSPKRSASCVPAAACWCSTCASTTRPGCATRFGDRHLGFSPPSSRRLLRDAGLRDVRVRSAPSKTGDPFAVLIASGVKSPDRQRARSRPGPQPKPRVDR